MGSVGIVFSPPMFRGSVVRKSSQAMSPHCTYFVPLTQIKKASAPVFPDTNNTQNTINQTNQVN